MSKFSVASKPEDDARTSLDVQLRCICARAHAGQRGPADTAHAGHPTSPRAEKTSKQLCARAVQYAVPVCMTCAVCLSLRTGRPTSWQPLLLFSQNHGVVQHDSVCRTSYSAILRLLLILSLVHWHTTAFHFSAARDVMILALCY